MTPASGSPQPDNRKAPTRISRRGFVGAAAVGSAVAAFGALRWFNVTADVVGTDLTAPQAWQAAARGDITLVDIRRSDEWRRTGVPQGAVALDLRRPDFVEALLAQTAGQKDTPVALICARGVRSGRLAARLREAGFSRIIDVPEGMLGSGAGPGWIARGLPVVKPG